jgi:hypothetical protein
MQMLPSESATSAPTIAVGSTTIAGDGMVFWVIVDFI